MSNDLGKKIIDRKGNIHDRDDWFSQQEAERRYKAQEEEAERLEKNSSARHYKHPENVQLGKERVRLLITITLTIIPFYVIYSLFLSFAAEHIDVLKFINGGHFFRDLGNYFMIYFLGTCLYIYLINRFMKRNKK